jgi:hypothetical protein
MVVQDVIITRIFPLHNFGASAVAIRYPPSNCHHYFQFVDMAIMTAGRTYEKLQHENVFTKSAGKTGRPIITTISGEYKISKKRLIEHGTHSKESNLLSFDNRHIVNFELMLCSFIKAKDT